MTTRSPFFTKDYERKKGRAFPIVDINLHINGKPVPVNALVDTGATGGLGLTADDVKKLGLILPKAMNDKPLRCELADNKLIGVYVYEVEIELDGEKRVSELYVIDPNIIIIDDEEEEKDDEVIGLLGRGFIDNFDVTFHGTVYPKKIAFIK